MFFYLRLLGITNAALWFGSAVFLVMAVWPAFSSPEMLRILPRSHSGAAAQVVWEQYLRLQYWFGGVALAHLLLETLYAGKPWRRRGLYLLAVLLGLGLLSGLLVAPRLKQLHLEIYGIRSTPQQRVIASRSFQVWEGANRLSGLLLILGLWGYLWELTRAEGSTRFVGAAKFRG